MRLTIQFHECESKCFFAEWFLYMLCSYIEMDEVVAAVADKIKNFAVIYLVDIFEVPDFNTMYELFDPSTVMFVCFVLFFSSETSTL